MVKLCKKFMIGFGIAVVALLILNALPFHKAIAADKEVTLSYQQEMCDDLKGWGVDWSLDGTTWLADDYGNPLDPNKPLIYVQYQGIPQDRYTVDQVLSFPDGVVSTLYVRMITYDNANNKSVWSNVVSAEVDFEAPVITVNSLSTTDSTPPLSGTVNDPTASIAVTILGANYVAQNNGDGSWSLGDNIIAPLSDGTYDVIATATDASGNIGVDATVDELLVNAEAPQPAEIFTITIKGVGQ